MGLPLKFKSTCEFVGDDGEGKMGGGVGNGKRRRKEGGGGGRRNGW